MIDGDYGGVDEFGESVEVEFEKPRRGVQLGRFQIDYSKVLVVAVVLAVAILTAMIARNTSSKRKQELAKSVVQCLYDFGTKEQLEAQQRLLKGKVTDTVYNQLTYDNEQRRLNTYLKFNEDSSTVKFLKVTDDCIFYSLECASIEPSRHFVFHYSVNSAGKISKVYEAELIDFIAGGKQWD